MTLLGPRRRDPELLDEPGWRPRDLAPALRHIAQVNRWLGGERALRLHLSPLRRSGRDVRVLDVGTGNAAVLERILRWGREGGGRWWGVGTDFHPQVLRVARQESGDGGARLLLADALALPFRPASFDVVLCTLTLHHFGDDDAAALVAELARVSRLVLVNDLERGVPGYLSARVLAATWWRRNALTRNDGPLSVLRSFTAEELRAIGRSGGLQRVQVRRRFPFRLVLEGRA